MIQVHPLIPIRKTVARVIGTARALEDLHHKINACTKCVDCGYLRQANPILSGTLQSRIMLIGQAPGIKNENEKFPFNGGRAGKRLFQWLNDAGWDEGEFRQKHYIGSVTRCFPGKNKSGSADRVPSDAEQALCLDWLRQELELLDIEVIILMGRLSINLFFDPAVPLSEIIGRSYQIHGYVVVPIPHPSGASSWYLKSANKVLLKQALASLAELKRTRNYL